MRKKQNIFGENGFHKFRLISDSGYKPPHGQNPKSPLDFFQLFFTVDLQKLTSTEMKRFKRTHLFTGNLCGGLGKTLILQ